MDGAITCGFGIIAYWWLVDFPDGKYGSWRFLNPRETQFMINRVNADRGDVQLEPFTWKKFLAEGRDPKVWAFACIFCFTTTITYALAFFLPLILRVGLGFSVQNSQILLAPPYFVGGVFMYLVGWAGDKWQIRGPFIIACMLVSLVGLPMIGWHPNPKIRYVGVFFLTTGSSACIPAIMAYQANNIRGQWKRAFCSASLVGFGGIGGIAGSLIFRTQDAPRYLPGIWACMAASIFNIIIIASLTIHFMRANNRAERGLALIENEVRVKYNHILEISLTEIAQLPVHILDASKLGSYAAIFKVKKFDSLKIYTKAYTNDSGDHLCATIIPQNGCISNITVLRQSMLNHDL